MDTKKIRKAKYIAPSILQETIPVGKAIINTLCKD